jgi:hypothetical protein
MKTLSITESEEFQNKREVRTILKIYSIQGKYSSAGCVYEYLGYFDKELGSSFLVFNDETNIGNQHIIQLPCNLAEYDSDGLNCQKGIVELLISGFLYEQKKENFILGKKDKNTISWINKTANQLKSCWPIIVKRLHF